MNNKIYNYKDILRYTDGLYPDEYRKILMEYTYEYIPDNSKYNGFEIVHNIVYLIDKNNNKLYLKIDERLNNYFYHIKKVYITDESIPKIMEYVKKFIIK